VAELEALACDVGALPYGREECVLLLELILILDGHRSYLDLHGSIIREGNYTYIFDKLRDPLSVLLAQCVSFLYRGKSFMIEVLSFSACSLRASGEWDCSWSNWTLSFCSNLYKLNIFILNK